MEHFTDYRAVHRLRVYSKIHGVYSELTDFGEPGQKLASFNVDFSGDCEEPAKVTKVGLGPQFRSKKFDKVVRLYQPGNEDAFENGTLTAYMSVRCRRCDRCVNWRRRRLCRQTEAEAAVGGRCWFVTLTFNKKERKKYESLQEFRKGALRHLTLFMKRLRKASKGRLRFISVLEAHSDGSPHLHMILIEPEGQKVIGERAIKTAWYMPHRLGFAEAKLIGTSAEDRTRAIRYVTKYITKAAFSVRHSTKWGDVTPTETVNPERSQELRPQPIAESVQTKRGPQQNDKHGDPNGGGMAVPERKRVLRGLRGPPSGDCPF